MPSLDHSSAQAPQQLKLTAFPNCICLNPSYPSLPAATVRTYPDEPFFQVMLALLHQLWRQGLLIFCPTVFDLNLIQPCIFLTSTLAKEQRLNWQPKEHSKVLHWQLLAGIR